LSVVDVILIEFDVSCELTTKAVNASSQEELENRLHALTETLIQKQTMIEALSTEKSSLGLQLERVEVTYLIQIKSGLFQATYGP